jgi:hypothetical protein
MQKNSQLYLRATQKQQIFLYYIIYDKKNEFVNTILNKH